jgi:NTP pyrophosphatase (non-canonical NTP hydrolase)
MASPLDRAWAHKVSHGFNTTDVPLEFCLLSQEVFEAFDAWRLGDPAVGSELADVAIYLLSLSRMTGSGLSGGTGAPVLGSVQVRICLLQAAVSKAFEAWAVYGGAGQLLADVANHLEDLARVLQVDLEAAIEAKLTLNESREYAPGANGVQQKVLP